MDYRKANRAFLYSVLSTLCLTFLYAMWTLRGGGEMPIVLNNIVSEMVVVIPMVSMVLYHGDRLLVVIPLKRIKISSALLVVLYTLLLYPLVTFVNSLSLLFVDNAALEIADQLVGEPMWLMILSMGVFGPFMEEIVFRGILLQSYQRSGRIIGSIILSSVLFGAFHMNFNQFAYGAVMGVMFALLVEATGSVAASFIAHAAFNTAETILMYTSFDAITEATDLLEEYDLQNEILMSIGVYFILAIIGTAIAMCVVYKISEIEGRKEFFSRIPQCKKQGYRLVTAPLFVAMVLSLAYMIAIAVISAMF